MDWTPMKKKVMAEAAKAGEHLRGLEEGLGQQGEAVLLLDALLDLDHDGQDHQAEDGHGQARGNAEDGERAGGEGLDETPSGDAGDAHEEQEQAEGGEGDADAVKLELARRSARSRGA